MRWIWPVSNTYSLSMIYAGFKRVGTWWNYKNVISPFYRLYYIEKGNIKVYINNIVMSLLRVHRSWFLNLLSIVMNAMILWIIITFVFDDPDRKCGHSESYRWTWKWRHILWTLIWWNVIWSWTCINILWCPIRNVMITIEMIYESHEEKISFTFPVNGE